MGIIKTVDGLAWASVKTMQGLAIASVKTIQGADSVTAGSSHPEFVAQYPSANWNTTTNDKAVMTAVAVNLNDILIGLGVDEGYAPVAVTYPITFTENGSAAWSEAIQSHQVESKTQLVSYSYVVTASPTETLTCAVHVSSVNRRFGGTILRFSASSGVGASNKAAGTTGYPSVALTTTVDNSAIVAIVGDYTATQSAATWATAGDCAATPCTAYPGDGSAFGCYIAYFADVGVAGAKTVAMTAPSGMNWNIIAVEVKGAA